MPNQSKMVILFIGIIFLLSIALAVWVPENNQNLIYYWAMDHQTGTTATENVSGVKNVTGLGQNWTTGRVNFGHHINGTDQGVTNINLTEFGVAWSMNFWINVGDSAAINSRIFDAGSGVSDFMVKKTGGLAYQITYRNLGIPTITPAQYHWDMVTLTRNSTGYTVYTNGTMFYTNATNANHKFKGDAFCFFNGGLNCNIETPAVGVIIDEVGMWNKTLTQNEITQLYNSGIGSYANLGAKFLDVNLNSPLNNSLLAYNDVFFNATVNASPSTTLLNSTLFLYYSNGSIASKLTNITNTQTQTAFNTSNLKGGDYLWNVKVEGNDSSNNTVTDIDSSNFTLAVGFSVNGEYWKNSTTEGNNELIQLNISIPSGSTISSANLIYNNSIYAGSLNQISASNYSITRNLIIDNILTTQNLPFYWNITLSSSSDNFQSNVHTQSVSIISLDSCASNPILIVNYSVLDEEARTYLSGIASNTTVEVDLNIYTLGTTNKVASFNKTFLVVNATNPARVCINGEILNSSSYRMDAVARYEAINHVSEFNNIQNFTLNNNTIPQLIDLHDLLSADSQEFLITFKDQNFLPVEGALIDINRKYIGEGVFRSVEVPKTDTDGQAIAHLVLGDVIYTFIVKKNGVILGTFPDITAFCNNQATGDCKINLNSLGSGVSPTEFLTSGNIAYNFNYNQTTRIISSLFTILDGSTSTILLNTTVLNGYNNITVCSDSITSSSGTLTCSIPSTIVNVSLVSRLYKDGVFVGQKTFSIDQDYQTRVYRGSIAILTIILFLTIPLLALTSGTATIILAMFAVVIMALLNLFDSGGILGIGSTILWALLAGGVLLWKINNR